MPGPNALAAGGIAIDTEYPALPDDSFGLKSALANPSIDPGPLGRLSLEDETSAWLRDEKLRSAKKSRVAKLRNMKSILKCGVVRQRPARQRVNLARVWFDSLFFTSDCR